MTANLIQLALPLILQGLGVLIGLSVAWILAREAMGVGWFKAHLSRADDQAAADRLGHFLEVATQSVLSTASEDLKAGKGLTGLAVDVVALAKQLAPEAIQEGGDALGIGEHVLEDYLLHAANAKLAVAIQAGKVAAAQVNTPQQAAAVLAAAAK